MKRLIIWLLVSVNMVGAWAQDVESALARFDKQPVAATANAFFDALLKEAQVQTPYASRCGIGLLNGFTTRDNTRRPSIMRSMR